MNLPAPSLLAGEVIPLIGMDLTMLYQLHEFNRALLGPATYLAHAGAHMFSAPGSWLANLPGSARIAAGYELMYRLGRDYPKPEFGIQAVEVLGAKVPVIEQTSLSKPFCRLLRFKRYSDDARLVSSTFTPGGGVMRTSA